MGSNAISSDGAVWTGQGTLKGGLDGVRCDAKVTYGAFPRSFRLAQAQQHLCRTYQVPLTDLVACPSADERIFTP